MLSEGRTLISSILEEESSDEEAVAPRYATIARNILLDREEMNKIKQNRSISAPSAVFKPIHRKSKGGVSPFEEPVPEKSVWAEARDFKPVSFVPKIPSLLEEYANSDLVAMSKD
jgi:hypothetical protein